MTSQKVHIEKLVFGGQGLAHLPDGKTVFVWNALPGEEVEIEFVTGKKNYAKAAATEIITRSPDRVEPKESHFLSSAPWQMMSWTAENKSKKTIALETYGRLGGLVFQEKEPCIIYDSERQYGYRSKIEFNFAAGRAAPAPEDPAAAPDEKNISLAFFNRGQKIRQPVAGSLLAEPVINEVAQNILAWINRRAIPLRSLKSLIIRSNHAGECIAALFIKDRLNFPDLPAVRSGKPAPLHGGDNKLLGFHLYYSTHKSPAAAPTKLLKSAGEDKLTVELLGTKLKFGPLSFFQVNLPMFEVALKDMAAFIGPRQPLVDFYSGVGSISLPLSRNRTSTILVDSNEEAIQYAQKNSADNKLPNCRAICQPAEKITELITPDSIIVLDPPRAGLHEKVVRRLLTATPPRLVYLSCDLATHARDINLLSPRYRVAFLKLYNFFPRTPHIEGLAVLDRI